MLEQRDWPGGSQVVLTHTSQLERNKPKIWGDDKRNGEKGRYPSVKGQCLAHGQKIKVC